MFSTFLATCVLVHGHDDGAKAAQIQRDVFIGDGYDRLGAGDGVGLANPGQGGLNQGCRTGYPEELACDAGLRCNLVNQGSFTTGTCVRDDRGGNGQPCRNGRDRCDGGLEAVTRWVHTEGDAFEVPRCRCEPEDDSNDGSTEDSDDILGSNPDWSGIIYNPKLGHGAPHTGRLGEPCDGNRCDSGLYCHYQDHGSYTTGSCVRDTQHAGGEGERCRTVQEGAPCDSGLQCNRVRFYPQGSAQICQRVKPVNQPGQEGQRCRTVQEGSPCEPGLKCQRVRLLPSGFRDICQDVTPHNEGENGQKCNEAPLAPCNHNNLAPRYETIPGGRSCTCHLNLAAAGPAPQGNDDSNPKLGMPAPHLGGWYEPCRNTFPHCNQGLYCKTTYSATASFGTCEPSYNPQPSPTPQPNRGAQGQRCRNGANQCDYGLKAVTNWENQYGQALQYPVCRCQRPLMGAGNPDSEKLGLGVGGVPTPALGTKGQGCRNGADGQAPCDDDLVCLKTLVNKATVGVCVHKPEDHGGVGQKCFPAPLSPCKPGLSTAKKDGKPDGHCVCEKKLGDSPKLGLPAPDLGTEGNGCRNNDGPWMPCNYGLYCQQWREGSATMGTCRRLPTPSPPSPHRHCGDVGQRCCGGNQCDYGLEAVTNWENQYGQALQYPVCRCEQMVGAAPGRD